jgi:adenine-specific DNA-methyltransferase
LAHQAHRLIPMSSPLPFPAVQRLPDLGAEYGEVYTRRWVVDLILDLAGYTADKDLAAMRAVEPSCGSGAFLIPMLERLLASAEKFGRKQDELFTAIRATDLLQASVESSRMVCRALLKEHGWSSDEITKWCKQSVNQADYLLTPHLHNSADFVIGNPPYIRLEDVSPELTAAYRKACPTMGGRADVYVGFWEIALRMLKKNGVIAYICADRWMRNAYGKNLRRYIINGSFSVDAVLTMHDVDAFEEEVSAYPAITLIRRAEQGAALVVDANERFDSSDATELVVWALSAEGQQREAVRTTSTFGAARLPSWFHSDDHWPTGSPARLLWLEELEEQFPLLEDVATGTRLGIGVATGADKTYITKDPSIVEKERLLPLAMSADIKSGAYEWSGNFLVNPWDDAGLVDLVKFPKLQGFFEANADVILKRNVAKRNKIGWFRTIDRVNHSLIERPKLLLEDMKSRPFPVLEPGGRYPHHNLYWIISDEWDLEVLGGLLLSDVVEAQISAYCVKMRGGTLRFQAQYLRRLRVPTYASIPSSVRETLAKAFRDRDVERNFLRSRCRLSPLSPWRYVPDQRVEECVETHASIRNRVIAARQLVRALFVSESFCFCLFCCVLFKSAFVSK